MPNSKKSLIISFESGHKALENDQYKVSILSVILLIMVVFILATFLAYAVFYFAIHNDNEQKFNRDKLEAQHHKIELLHIQLKDQEEYLKSIQTFFGKRIVDTLGEHISVKRPISNYDELSTELTNNEKQLFDGGIEVNKELKGKKYKLGEVSTPFVVPISGFVSQKFNKNVHAGTDVVADKGSKVNACLDGKVLFCGHGKKDGHVVILAHPGGWTSVYKHLKSFSVKSGMYVKAGQAIGIIGNSGENSNGPHLHFELWNAGNPVDPETQITFRH